LDRATLTGYALTLLYLMTPVQVIMNSLPQLTSRIDRLLITTICRFPLVLRAGVKGKGLIAINVMSP